MLKRSPWVFCFNAGGCNGCIIELLAAFSPHYDAERFGALIRGSAKHADILLVTGYVNKQCAKRLKKIYEQLPEPKRVIAIGACALSGGAFKGGDNFAGSVDSLIPVNIRVPGCPPRPEAIIEAVLSCFK